MRKMLRTIIWLTVLAFGASSAYAFLPNNTTQTKYPESAAGYYLTDAIDQYEEMAKSNN